MEDNRFEYCLILTNKFTSDIYFQFKGKLMAEKSDKTTYVCSLNEFKKMILEISDDALESFHPRFSDFKHRMLRPAVKEINQKTDINISFTPDRENSRVTKGLVGIIENKKPVSPNKYAPH